MGWYCIGTLFIVSLDPGYFETSHGCLRKSKHKYPIPFPIPTHWFSVQPIEETTWEFCPYFQLSFCFWGHSLLREKIWFFHVVLTSRCTFGPKAHIFHSKCDVMRTNLLPLLVAFRWRPFYVVLSKQKLNAAAGEHEGTLIQVHLAGFPDNRR